MNTDKAPVFYQCSSVFICGSSCFAVFQQALQLHSLLLLSQINSSVESVKGGRHTAAVDDTFEIVIEAQAESEPAGIVLLHRGGSAERDFEIAVDVGAHGLELHVGLDIGRQRHVDGAIQAAEGQRLGGIDTIHDHADRDRKSVV